MIKIIKRLFKKPKLSVISKDLNGNYYIRVNNRRGLYGFVVDIDSIDGKIKPESIIEFLKKWDIEENDVLMEINAYEKTKRE